MRITGGKASGIPLRTPKNRHTRPATDQLREALFASLGSSITDLTVADLFAGSGAYGLEALSRGAARAQFYESNREALRNLRENTENVRRACSLGSDSIQIQPGDLHRSRFLHPSPDLLIIDPPYAELDFHLDQLFSHTLTQLPPPPANIILEIPGHRSPTLPGWQISRRIGKPRPHKPTLLILHAV